MTTPLKRTRPLAGGRRFDTERVLEGARQLYGTATPTQVLLPRLHNVRSTGTDSWRADCPNGHDHAKGSLAIRCGSDGVMLLHCFACGDTAGILAAVGLTVADLFPERIKDPSPDGRRAAREAFKQSAWSAALRTLARESAVVEAAAGMLAHGERLSAEDHERLTTARQRIEDARAVLA